MIEGEFCFLSVRYFYFGCIQQVAALVTITRLLVGLYGVVSACLPAKAIGRDKDNGVSFLPKVGSGGGPVRALILVSICISING